MKKNRRIAHWTIVALTAVIFMVTCLTGCNQKGTDELGPSIGIEQNVDRESEATDKSESSTKRPSGVGNKADNFVKESDDVTTELEAEPEGFSQANSGTTGTKANVGSTTLNESQQLETTVESSETEVPKPIVKTEPVEGVDFTIPTGLKGTADKKLSTVSLGNSHLVWSNPEQVMSENKLCYQAKFVETDTKSEKLVTISVQVSKKTEPVEGKDYTIPKELKGTDGQKLLTVSLQNSHLIWDNPNEVMTVKRTLYLAKFAETTTRSRKYVWLRIDVTQAANDGNDANISERPTDSTPEEVKCQHGNNPDTCPTCHPKCQHGNNPDTCPTCHPKCQHGNNPDTCPTCHPKCQH
ncbi:MAG: hypothetical protein HFJ29_09485, partial [Clostridia bacterium]|nr:hypothetical protein [Clostridia bacterium]